MGTVCIRKQLLHQQVESLCHHESSKVCSDRAPEQHPVWFLCRNQEGVSHRHPSSCILWYEIRNELLCETKDGPIGGCHNFMVKNVWNSLMTHWFPNFLEVLSYLWCTDNSLDLIFSKYFSIITLYYTVCHTNQCIISNFINLNNCCRAKHDQQRKN